MHSSKNSLSAELSQRIALVRVLCIFGMIYVHVPSGLGTELPLALDVTDFFSSLQAFLVEGYGRASACLLSIVSGFLTAQVLDRPGTQIRQLYRRRFSSMLLPMVLWGTLTVLIYALVSLSRPTFLNIEYSNGFHAALQYLNFVFFLTDMPTGATMHLAFLRDLFACILLSPLLLMALRRLPWVTMLALAVIYLFDLESVIILRPLVVLGFSAGLLLSVRKVNLAALDELWWLWSGLSIAATLLLLAFNAGKLEGLNLQLAAYGLDAKESLLYPITRLFGSLAIWSITARMWQGSFARGVRTLTPFIFVAYCSHQIVLTLLFFSIWQPLFGDHTGMFYPLWFIIAPAIAIAMAAAGLQLLVIWAPALARLLIGGRVQPVRYKLHWPSMTLAAWCRVVLSHRNLR